MIYSDSYPTVSNAQVVVAIFLVSFPDSPSDVTLPHRAKIIWKGTFQSWVYDALSTIGYCGVLGRSSGGRMSGGGHRASRLDVRLYPRMVQYVVPALMMNTFQCVKYSIAPLYVLSSGSYSIFAEFQSLRKVTGGGAAHQGPILEVKPRCP